MQAVVVSTRNPPPAPSSDSQESSPSSTSNSPLLPPSTSSTDGSVPAGPLASKAVVPASASNTFLASLSRTLIFLAGMMLKRPARIFRPSKVSTFAFIKALAQRDGRSLGPTGILGLLKDYGPWSLILPLIPTLIINTTLTTLLFTTHSFLSSLLSHVPPFARPRPPPSSPPESLPPPSPSTDHLTHLYHRNTHSTFHPTLLSALAGAGAGIAQGTLATPVQKLVAFLSRIITGSGRKKPSPSSSASPSRPPTTTTASGKGGLSSSTSLAGSVKSRKDTLVWLKELRTAGVAGSSGWDGNWRGLSKLGFEGWRWTIAKDGVGYALFFATFDSSRRLALHVREIIDASQPRAALSTPISERPMAFFGLDDDDDEEENNEEGGLGRTGSKWGRLSQAGVLVAGGITAGTLFQLSSRPFDAVLHLLQSPQHLPSSHASRHFSRHYLLNHLRHPLHPSQRNAKYRTTGTGTDPLPAFPLIVRTLKTRGLGFFFGPQEREGRMGGPLWKRFAWKFAGVVPWGAGFLVFAWVGGEV
ncbi:hypothetical protein BDY24DRAFT_45057 [Mrakia frigida]|uniref:uncharacterized protein n=1 Tax=Mrakia frigida TaxID=29902 RepID=UPI003FCBFF77